METQVDVQIKTEIRYWQGILEGLRISSSSKDVEKTKTEAECRLSTLRWVLTLLKQNDTELPEQQESMSGRTSRQGGCRAVQP